jgi:hypothetical protein
MVVKIVVPTSGSLLTGTGPTGVPPTAVGATSVLAEGAFIYVYLVKFLTSPFLS